MRSVIYGVMWRITDLYSKGSPQSFFPNYLEKLLSDKEMRKEMGSRCGEIIAGWNHDKAYENLCLAIKYSLRQT